MEIPKILLDVEAVLKGQGADPVVIAERKPGLIKIAQNALEIGLPLIHPETFSRPLEIISFENEKIILEGGIHILSDKIAELLKGASTAQAVICTIGDELETKSAELFRADPTLALALDGLANAAVDQLVEVICCELEADAKAESLSTSMPVSPGSTEWPLEIGQPLLFKAVKPNPDIIRLSESFLMVPKKSSSFIVGIGKGITKHGKTCDHCSAREFCRYKIRKKF